jgi:hypothetical protein
VTVNLSCWCGAELTIDDASELASAAILTAFYAAHPHGAEPWSKYQVSAGLTQPLEVRH